MEILLFILYFLRTSQVALGQQYFRVKPHDTSVVVGRTAELHCHIGNRAGLVQWSKDGFLLGYDPDIPGYERYEMRVDHSNSEYTLLVHEANLDDEAEFQCQVGPGKNEKPIRSVARLTVLVPPKYLSINDLLNGSEIEVREAEKVVLQCQALASKPAAILKWYRKNIELMPEASRTTVRREGEKLYSTLSSITLYPKGDTSGSIYTCEALHPALERSLRTTVSVGVLYPPGPPRIEGHREEDIIEVGDDVTLVCTSTGGKPRAFLEWSHNGNPIEGSFSSAGRDSRNTLSFLASETDNNAVYSCAASNPLTPTPLLTSIKLSVIFPPKHVYIEGPSDARIGESVTLNCRSDVSNPPVKLTWLLDGESLEPLDTAAHQGLSGWYTTSNLTVIITRQDKNSKVFACIAHGAPRHEKVFQTFNLSVLHPPGPPIITGYDENLKLKEGDHQSFTCSTLAGNPPAELKWYRGDAEVPSVTTFMSSHISSILTFEVDASDNEQTVRCEVNNSVVPEPLSTAVILSVLFPPANVSISVDPPQPREGSTVRLTCWSGSSNPTARIFWWKNNSLLKQQYQTQTTDSAHGGSSTRSQINVPLTSKDDGSRFTCEAKNDAFQRSVQEHVTLRVLHAPVFMTAEKVVEMVEGQSGEVNMTAQAYPEVHSYRWSKDGISITRKTDSFRQSPSISADAAVLYFNHVSRHNSGAYTCVAQNLEGTASATVTLNVLYPASVMNITGTTDVTEGESAHLECTADGNPMGENTISWRRRDRPEKPFVSLNSEIGHSLLIIGNITRRDAGILECVADNGVGKSSVAATQIVVLYRPSISKKSTQRLVAADEEEEVQLECSAEGYPRVTFAWSFNGTTITPKTQDSQKYSMLSKQKSNTEWCNTLLIKTIRAGDYGIYTCIAGNQLGHDYVTFTIVQKRAPDIPEELEALNISHQSVLLSWSSGFDGGLAQSFQLKLRKHKEIPVTIIPIPVGSTSFLLSGLQQGASYEVSIAAKNTLGDSPYTTPIIFRTKSLPVMDSTISRPVSSGVSSGEFFPAWLLAGAVIGGLVVVANILVCIIYIRRKHWCRRQEAAPRVPAADDEVSRDKITKKIPPEQHSPFYLTGASVDMPDDGLDVDTFQKSPEVKLRQVSRESSEDGHTSGRRCDCGGRQWGSTLICGGRTSGEEQPERQHEQCPDILKRDSCHCHSSITVGMRPTEVDVERSANLGAVMYGKKILSSDTADFCSRSCPSPPQITLTTFQSKSELPIRQTIIGPKLETVINGHGDDS